MSEANVKRVKTSEIELKDRLVAVNRVTKVTKGGRAFRFAAIVVVGDEHGVVGHGLGKSKEVSDAVSKGVDDAKKNLVKVPVIRGTVPHEGHGKFGGALVFLRPAAPHESAAHRTCSATADGSFESFAEAVRPLSLAPTSCAGATRSTRWRRLPARGTSRGSRRWPGSRSRTRRSFRLLLGLLCEPGRGF